MEANEKYTSIPLVLMTSSAHLNERYFLNGEEGIRHLQSD